MQATKLKFELWIICLGVYKDKKEGYGELEYDRRWMSENLTKAIVQSVCKYLEDKHIATFNFDNDSCVYQSASVAL